MKGVVYLGDSEVEVRDFSQPEPGPGQVVIQSTIGCRILRLRLSVNALQA